MDERPGPENDHLEQPAAKHAETRLEVRLARARPITGGLLGLIIGLTVAVLLQQHGIWPLDKLTGFLLPALVGLLGVLITWLGREKAQTALTTALIVLVPMSVWGVTGFFSLNQSGQVTGECTLTIESSVDATNVVQTSRTNPFQIAPDGAMNVNATTPVVFQNFNWEYWVDVAGFHVVLNSGTEANPWEGTEVTGRVDNINEYLRSFGVPAGELRGIFKVGGEAAICSAFGFVYIQTGVFSTWTSRLAALIGVATLVFLVMVAFTGRKRPVETPYEEDTVDPVEETMVELEETEVLEEPGQDADPPSTDRPRHLDDENP